MEGVRSSPAATLSHIVFLLRLAAGKLIIKWRRERIWLLILKYLPPQADQLEMLRPETCLWKVWMLRFCSLRADQSGRQPHRHQHPPQFRKVKVWEVGSGCMLTRKWSKWLWAGGSYSMLIRLFTRQHPPPPLEINSYHNRHAVMPPNEAHWSSPCLPCWCLYLDLDLQEWRREREREMSDIKHKTWSKGRLQG